MFVGMTPYDTNILNKLGYLFSDWLPTVGIHTPASCVYWVAFGAFEAITLKRGVTVRFDTQN